MTNFTTGKELLALCESDRVAISEMMLRREVDLFGVTREQALERMQKSLTIMEQSVHQALYDDLSSMGGLLGGEAKKLAARGPGTPVCGHLMSRAVSYAMGVMEVNTSMGLIVAAPTAGSAGVLPGALFSVAEEYEISKGRLVSALFNAAAIGYLITLNATVSGAEGGCQAEVGAACAMAASAVAELCGASPALCLDAAATALSNVMGLVCDPVGGLVEAPCQRRNAMGVSNALVCAELALCGVRSHIPFDEVVGAMYAVGKSLPSELRETAMGGIAATPTARKLCPMMCGRS